MDIETLRLEREEKRRQRRERIRRILEDDPTRPTREETDSSRTTRSTAASRRPRENTAATTTSERTRNYNHVIVLQNLTCENSMKNIKGLFKRSQDHATLLGQQCCRTKILSKFKLKPTSSNIVFKRGQHVASNNVG